MAEDVVTAPAAAAVNGRVAAKLAAAATTTAVIALLGKYMIDEKMVAWVHPLSLAGVALSDTKKENERERERERN